jgi:hypothetical protein
VKVFLKYFVMQVLAYGVCDCSSRFVAQGASTWAVSTGMLYAVLAFTIIRKVSSEPKSLAAISGYVLGGGIGTYLGIIVSRFVTGQ